MNCIPVYPGSCRLTRYIVTVSLLIPGVLSGAEQQQIEITVRASEDPLPALTAGESRIDRRQLKERQVNSAAELMQTVPGLRISQHTGGAKAHQIFLRGYDAEHGLDLAAFLDGIPLNETSHIHGHGYLDLHFLIPEALERIDVSKGPYNTRYGNFAAAGAVNFVPLAAGSAEPSQAGLTVSNFPGARLHGLYHTPHTQNTGGSQPTHMAAGAALVDRGYTDPGDQYGGQSMTLSRFSLAGAEARLLTAAYYRGSQAADIVPEYAVSGRQVDRFGAVDDSGGVESVRLLTGYTEERRFKETVLTSRLYYSWRSSTVFSNFTYYLQNERGDQTRQHDQRHYAGLSSEINRGWLLAGAGLKSQAGVSFRSDFVDQSTHDSVRRKPTGQRQQFNFTERNLSLWVEQQVLPHERIEFQAGLRFDRFDYNGHGSQDTMVPDPLLNTGRIYDDRPLQLASAAQAFSPKLSFAFHETADITTRLSAARGIVSRDARAMAVKPRSDVPAVEAAEVEQKAALFQRVVILGAAGWYSRKDEEYVFSAVDGVEIARGASRRMGFDLEGEFRKGRWQAGVHFSLVDARLESGRRLVDVPQVLCSQFAAVSLKQWQFSAIGRYVGRRQHNLGLSSPPYWLLDLLASYDYRQLTFTLHVKNVFNTAWRDSAYGYASRLKPGGSVVESVHFTPGTPLSFEAGLTWHFGGTSQTASAGDETNKSTNGE